jgi:hypothetical protein
MTTWTRIACSLVIVVFVVVLRAAPALAQAAGEPEDQTMVIPRTPPPPPASPPMTAPATSLATGRALTMEEVSNPSMEEMQIRGLRARYSLNFFGDTSLSWGRPNAPLSFALGPQDVLLKGELGNHIVTTTEFAMESTDAGVILDVERFNVRWQGDGFYIEAGRSHTAFGYWNNAYHHGSWLQPTIDRPRWVAFEDDGGILPVHWVGLDLGAKLKMPTGTLNLYFSVGNGRGKIVDDVRNAGDYQSLKALHVGVDYVGIHWPELRAGISAVVDRIPAQPAMDADGAVVRPALPDVAIDEIIGGAYVAYASFPLVLISEGYLVAHNADGHTWKTYGGFVLLGYAFGRVTPYGEFERIAHSGGDDPFLNPDPAAPDPLSFDTVRGIGGIRVDLSDWTALKAEYRYTKALDSSTTFQEGILNWSWGF